ncbi:MAG: AI-2E family transporter, partial [Clostridiales bacterium]|nr:AI-2E family transporter [Clostridiales bacterium]
IIPAIYSNVSLFISNTPTYYDRLLDFVDYINGLDIIGLHISIDKIMAMVEETLQGLNLDNILSSINALLGFSSAVFNIFLAFISSIYILVEKDKFKTFLRRLLTVFSTSGAYAAIIKYAGKLNKNFKQYIYTQTIDGLIIGSLSAIELYLLGSPYALVLGLTLGLINYIPYFGSIIGSIIAVMIVAFTQGLPTGAIAAVVLIVTQQIDGNIIQPRLMGDSFSLSPLLIIISITIGEAVAGVLGMIAAIPIIAVLKDIFESIIVYYERKKSDSKD